MVYFVPSYSYGFWYYIFYFCFFLLVWVVSLYVFLHYISSIITKIIVSLLLFKNFLYIKLSYHFFFHKIKRVSFLTLFINHIYLFYALFLILKLLFLHLLFHILLYNLLFYISIDQIYFLLNLFHVFLDFRTPQYFSLANRIIKDDVCLSNFFNCFFALSVNTTLYLIIKSQLLFYFV